jgi:hypothetical protein
MSSFGMTVATYNQKPNAYLSKMPTMGVQPQSGVTTVNAGTSSPAPSVDTAPVSQMNSQIAPNKTALSGSTGPAASGYVSPIQSSIFQPMFTSQMGQHTDSIWGRENSNNATTQIANNNMQAQVDSRNQQIGKFNQNQQNSDSYAQGGDVSGVGGAAGLDAEQMQNAQTISNIGKQRGLGDNAIQIAIMTGLTESGLRNLHGGDRDSQGIFQQRPSQGWGSVAQVTDPNYAANKFYDSLAKTNYASMTPWAAAQQVQRSAFTDGSNYQKQYGQAQRAYQALSSGSFNNIASTGGGSNSAASWIQSYNNKYVDYDGKFGAQCVDLYNYYTAGFVGGRNIMVGYAPEIFNKYDASAYTRYGANQGSGHMGDVAVFRPGGSTPSGHVAIVVGDNGNGTLRVLQANATSRGSAGPTIISNISKASLMGYLRPNKLG